MLHIRDMQVVFLSYLRFYILELLILSFAKYTIYYLVLRISKFHKSILSMSSLSTE